jgi:hypothetical protein
MNVGQLFVMLGLQVNQGQWNQGMSVIKGLRSAATGLIAALGVRSIVNLVEHTTEAATHLVSLSRAMGMTIEQTQEWGYVAAQSGSNLKELSVGMNMLERNLRLFAEGRGSKVLRDRFTELGFTRDEAQKAIDAGPTGTQNVILKIADGVHKMDEGMRKATNTQLFGVRAGRAMLADIERGSDGLKELFERRRKMGELTEDDALNLRGLGNRIKDVHTSLDALAQKAVAQLAPMLTDLAERAVQWISANRELLTGALEVAVRGVALAFEAVGAIVSWVSDLIHDAMGGDDGATAILIGIAVAIGTILVPALWSMAAPIIAATWPFLAIAAIVALIAYGILQVVKHADAIGAAITSAVDRARKRIKEFWDYVTGENAADNLGKDISDALSHAWDVIKEKAFDVLDSISKKAREIPVFGWLGEKIGQGAGMLTNAVTGARHLDMDPGDTLISGDDVAPGNIHNAPSAAAQAAAQAAANNTTQQPNVTIGPTHVEINVNSVEDAKRAHDAFQDDRTDNAIRHAVSSVGGEVK